LRLLPTKLDRREQLNIGLREIGLVGKLAEAKAQPAAVAGGRRSAISSTASLAAADKRAVDGRTGWPSRTPGRFSRARSTRVDATRHRAERAMLYTASRRSGDRYHAAFVAHCGILMDGTRYGLEPFDVGYGAPRRLSRRMREVIDNAD